MYEEHLGWQGISQLNFFLNQRKLRQERIQLLKENGLVVDLEQIVLGTDKTVVVTDMWHFGREYWLLDIDIQDFEGINDLVYKKIKGSKVAVYLDRGQLLCQKGVPLKTAKALKKSGIKPRAFWIFR